MHGVTSTGNNAENCSTSGEGSSTEITQGQTQGGRSVQQQMRPIPVALLDGSFQVLGCSDGMEARPIASRQATGSNTMKSVQSQEGQCTRESNLPELRRQATKDFFRHIEELIDAKKPGASETRKPCNPESAAGADEISKVFKRPGVQEDEFKEKNTLSLCLMLVKKNNGSS